MPRQPYRHLSNHPDTCQMSTHIQTPVQTLKDMSEQIQIPTCMYRHASEHSAHIQMPVQTPIKTFRQMSTTQICPNTQWKSRHPSRHPDVLRFSVNVQMSGNPANVQTSVQTLNNISTPVITPIWTSEHVSDDSVVLQTPIQPSLYVCIQHTSIHYIPFYCHISLNMYGCHTANIAHTILVLYWHTGLALVYTGTKTQTITTSTSHYWHIHVRK